MCYKNQKLDSELPIEFCEESFEIEKNVFCHLNKKKNKYIIDDNDDDENDEKYQNDENEQNDQNYYLQFSFKTLLSFSLLLL